jgi:hypothetical protein
MIDWDNITKEIEDIVAIQEQEIEAYKIYKDQLQKRSEQEKLRLYETTLDTNGYLMSINGNITSINIQKLEIIDEDVLDHFDEFKSVYQEGDVFWFYNDIEFLSGEAGYVLIRGNKVVSSICTVMS